MPKTPDQLMETETIIRWDESSTEAVLWTASNAVRKQWESFGFVNLGTNKHGIFRVPIDRITYKPLKDAK
jgi:hypothetical protein